MPKLGFIGAFLSLTVLSGPASAEPERVEEPRGRPPSASELTPASPTTSDASDPPRLEGQVGLSMAPFGRFRAGIEGEFGLTGLPFRVGGVAWAPLFGSGIAQTAWAGYAVSPQPGDRLMLMLGGTHYAQSVGCIDVCSPVAQHGIFVGLSYLIREERLWIQLTPQYLFPIGGHSAYPSWALSGVPWVEVGMSVTPNCDISFRFGETLFKVAYKL